MRRQVVRNMLSHAYKTSKAITESNHIYDDVRQRRVKNVLSTHSLNYTPDIIETTSALKSYTTAIRTKHINGT